MVGGGVYTGEEREREKERERESESESESERVKRHVCEMKRGGGDE